jgi:hypothetical protein
MVLVLSRGGFCPKERRLLVESNQFDSAIDYPACRYHVSCLWTCVASFKVDKPTEFDMSSTRSESAIESSRARTVDMKLEVVVIPVSDVDRAKRFYGGLGWRLDADLASGNEFRVVQFTPPGSPCSIHFGTGRGRYKDSISSCRTSRRHALCSSIVVST